MYFHLISYVLNTTPGKLIYYYKCKRTLNVNFFWSTKLVKMFQAVVKECRYLHLLEILNLWNHSFDHCLLKNISIQRFKSNYPILQSRIYLSYALFKPFWIWNYKEIFGKSPHVHRSNTNNSAQLTYSSYILYVFQGYPRHSFIHEYIIRCKHCLVPSKIVDLLWFQWFLFLKNSWFHIFQCYSL